MLLVRKHDICVSICRWIGVKLSTLLQYIATGPIARSHWSKLEIYVDGHSNVSHQLVWWELSVCQLHWETMRPCTCHGWHQEPVWRAERVLRMQGVLVGWHQLRNTKYYSILCNQAIKKADIQTWNTYHHHLSEAPCQIVLVFPYCICLNVQAEHESHLVLLKSQCSLQDWCERTWFYERRTLFWKGKM